MFSFPPDASVKNMVVFLVTMVHAVDGTEDYKPERFIYERKLPRTTTLSVSDPQIVVKIFCGSASDTSSRCGVVCFPT